MIKILIVEDDLPTYEFIQLVLKPRGYDVVHTVDGSRVLGLAKEHKPQLILLDVMLPFLDGYSIQSQLLEDPQTKQIPVIVMTSKGSMEDIFLSSSNVKGFIPKPFNVKDLLAKIDTALK